jgi:hypothetical protein
MFNSRKDRRNRLKKSLIKEARLTNYSRQFDAHIKRLENSLGKYVGMAKKGKELNNEYMMKTGVKYARYVENNITKMLVLKTNLEVARINLDNQDAYTNFLNSVSEFTSEIKNKERPSNWFIRKVLRRYFKQTKNLAKEVKLIDRKLDRIDKNIEVMFTETGRLDEVDVKSFFEQYK